MSDPIVITRELVKRGWSDFEPKLITGLLTGSVAAFLVSLLAQYGIHLSSLQENFIAVACFFVGGYLTPSTGTAVTKRIDAGLREVEQHSGPVVTTVTAPTAIQQPSTPIQQTSPGVFTKVIQPENPDEKPTEVLPPYSRGQSILSAIQQNTQENR